jgi:hypothetical protein
MVAVAARLIQQEDLDSHTLAMRLWRERTYDPKTESHLIGFDTVLQAFVP